MSQQENWGSRVGLILAMAGNAVGLGNFLRFPIKAVENGGASFIIPYLVCFLLMGVPLLWMEWTMGRYGGRHGNHSTPYILDNMARGRFWKYIGVFGIFTNIGVASYYCYIESWTLTYVINSVAGTFTGMEAHEVSQFFDEYIAAGIGLGGILSIPVLAYLVCLAINTYFLSRGLQGGVEKVATWAMPVLIGFGVILAIRGLTLGQPAGTEGCLDCNANLALNYLWEPTISGLNDPRVWFEAAGQIFFTLSVGMGTIHCYSSYVKAKDDIALNAMTAGWMNGFVEVVLGASVVIPIATGYLGLDWVKENAGFSMAFQTMPYLFEQWGSFIGPLMGLFWFGLLFIAGITSSLAMGTPWLGFMEDEFNWSRGKAALSFGGILLLVGLPTILFFNRGVFDEYDFWAGTASLVIFATIETILFSWIFGVNKGWDELMKGADLRPPKIFKFFMLVVTPVMLIVLFLGSFFTPKDNDWEAAFTEGYELDASSIIGKIQNKKIKANRAYFSDEYESDFAGVVTLADNETKQVAISDTLKFYENEFGNILQLRNPDELKPEFRVFDSVAVVHTYTLASDANITAKKGQLVAVGDVLAKGAHTNNIFFLDMSRLFLLLVFLVIAGLVYVAFLKRKREGRMNFRPAKRERHPRA